MFNDLNCPNCGAPITGEKCEYCGTLFNIKRIDKIDADRPIFGITTAEAVKAIAKLSGVLTPNEIRGLYKDV